MTSIRRCRSAGLFACALALLDPACKRDAAPSQDQAAKPVGEGEVEKTEAAETTEATGGAGSETGAEAGAAEDPIMTATDFRFEWQRGSGAVFIEELSVDAEGRATWLRPVREGDGFPVIRALDFELTAEELEALRAAVVEAGFMDLDPDCGGADGVADGGVLFVRVRADGALHRLACGDSPLAELAPIRAVVEALETEARVEALAAAPEAPPGAGNPDLKRPPP